MSTRQTVLIVLVVVAVFLVVTITGGVFVVRHLGRLVGPKLSPALEPGKSIAGKPIPCGPDVVTGRQSTECRRSYYRKGLALAYRQAGQHSPRWDAAAERFLEALALRYAEHDDTPEETAFDVMAQQLVRSGCSDALVLSRLGQYYLERGQKPRARVYLTRALAGLKLTRYPPAVWAWTYHTMACVQGEAGSRLERADFKWRPLAINAFADASDAKFFGPHEQRAMWEDIDNIMDKDFRRSQAVIVTALKKRPHTDPWLLNMAWGKHARDYAWANRGTGWARDVKPGQWQEFGRYSQMAREYYEKAYALHPEYPEAAAELLAIVNSAGGKPGESERLWFDRCVAAQMDFMPAYYGMLNALLPRWGGSHRNMLAFGQECLNTQRYDTRVPFVYSEAVDMIAERDRQTEVWNQPEVYSNIRTCFEGYIAYYTQHPLPKEKELVNDLRTRLALKAYQAGHLDVARQQVDAMHGSLAQATMDRYWCERAELVAGEICARTGTNSDAVALAENLFDTQKTAEALAAFAQLLPQEKDGPGRFYVRDRIQTLTWEKQFAAGQWVELGPTPDLVGWSVWLGSFTPLKQGSGFVVVPGDNDYALMMCNMRPGRWYELRCEVEFPDRKLKGIEAGFAVDVATACGTPYYDTYRIIRSPATAYSGYMWSENQEHALGQVPRRFTMRLIQCDDRVTMYMDDQTVFQDRRLEDKAFRVNAPHVFGIGGETYPDKMQPVIYRNLRIHSMK